MRQFFQNFRVMDGNEKRASHFLMAIYEGGKIFPDHLFQNLEKEEIPQFFQELLEQLREWLHLEDQKEYPGISLSILEKWNRSIRQSYRSVESLNLSGMLLLEDLFYRLRNQL